MSAGARRVIASQRAAPTSANCRGIRRARTALGCFGRGNADAAYVFLTRAGRVVREMFLICIYLNKKVPVIKLLPLRRRAT